MNEIQKIRVNNLRDEYQKNLNDYINYGSERFCNFEIRKSNIEDDNSITVVSTLIEDLTDENIPFTKQVFYNILTDGEVITMNFIMPRSSIANYISQTTKI